MKEEAVLFGSSVGLAGIITDPDVAPPSDRPAIVFLNAGVTHRIGPSRLYVRLARELACAGFASLRFDFSGLGDSGVRTDDMPPAQSVVVEARAAMDLLAEKRGIERFVLTGICSGATISYLIAREDIRTVGVALINAQGHLHGKNPALGSGLRSRTLTRHFWRIATTSSFRSKNWVKAVRGQLDPKRILRMMVGLPLRAIFGRREVAAGPVEHHDALADLRSVVERDVRVLHLYSEGDEGLDYFNVVLGARADEVTEDPRSELEIMRGANHVFTLLWSQDRLVESFLGWTKRCFASADGGDASSRTR